MIVLEHIVVAVFAFAILCAAASLALAWIFVRLVRDIDYLCDYDDDDEYDEE